MDRHPSEEILDNASENAKKTFSSRKRSRRSVKSDQCSFPAGVCIGRLVGLSSTGEPLVDYEGNTIAQGMPAQTCVSLTKSLVGSQVVLSFQREVNSKPIVLGTLRNTMTTSKIKSEEPLESEISFSPLF